MHIHRMKKRTEPYGFSRQVPLAVRVNHRAHGCVTYSETCSCGAKRLVNANGTSREVGPWTPEPNEGT